MSQHDRTRRGTRGATADDDFDARLNGRLDGPLDENEPFDGGDDLRYEGPISFDDVDDEPRAADPGGSRVVFTALLIGAAVILLVGVALWLRRDVPPEVRVSQADEAAATVPPARGTTTSLEDKIAAAPSLPGPETAAGAAILEDEPSAPPSPDDGSESGGAPVGDRPDEAAPDELAAAAAPPREAAPPPERDRPAPAAASLTGAPPRPAPAVRAEAPPAGGSMRDMVKAGDLEGAARAGSYKARSSHDAYGLQLGHLCSAGNIKAHFAAVPDGRLLLLPGKEAGCYRLLWGTYDDAAAARGAVGSVPPRFKDTPRPVALGSILAR